MMFLPAILAVAIAEGDPELVARLKRRDGQAMADLYDRYGRLVYSLIYRTVRDTGVAEDLVQETFLRVWNRAQAFNGERGSLGAWLTAVARNRAIDYLRSVEGRMRGVLETDTLDHPGNFIDMEAQLFHADSVRRIRVALERLNPNQRNVIELAYFEGLSQTEMAARMGQPLGTVKTWVRTALKSLREELSQATAV